VQKQRAAVDTRDVTGIDDGQVDVADRPRSNVRQRRCAVDGRTEPSRLRADNDTAGRVHGDIGRERPQLDPAHDACVREIDHRQS